MEGHTPCWLRTSEDALACQPCLRLPWILCCACAVCGPWGLGPGLASSPFHSLGCVVFGITVGDVQDLLD